MESLVNYSSEEDQEQDDYENRKKDDPGRSASTSTRKHDKMNQGSAGRDQHEANLYKDKSRRSSSDHHKERETHRSSKKEDRLRDEEKLRSKPKESSASREYYKEDRNRERNREKIKDYKDDRKDRHHYSDRRDRSREREKEKSRDRESEKNRELAKDRSHERERNRKEKQKNDKNRDYRDNYKHKHFDSPNNRAREDRKRNLSRSRSRDRTIPNTRVSSSSSYDDSESKSNYRYDHHSKSSHPHTNTIGNRLPIAETASSSPLKDVIKSSNDESNKTNSGTPFLPPNLYNPNVINLNKYAEQVQKRKLLWSNKKTEDTSSKWNGAKFAQDTDGKVASKFMRLMGIKSAPKATDGNSTLDQTGNVKSEDIEKREEMFSSMEQQYEVARQVTHTMRGVGLGFSSQARPF